MWQMALEAVADFLPKALLAILCGGLVGLEREVRRKPAGFRTNILICLGSMVFMWLSTRVALTFSAETPGDPARIAAQVVTGIGFLGAGTIIQSRGIVRGLTSAALIWVVAAIGMSIGAGLVWPAVTCTALVLLVQFGLGLVERRFFGQCVYHSCEVVFDDRNRESRDEIEMALQGHGAPLDEFSLQPAGEHVKLTLRYCTEHPHHRKIINSLLRIRGVREVRPLPEPASPAVAGRRVWSQ